MSDLGIFETRAGAMCGSGVEEKYDVPIVKHPVPTTSRTRTSIRTSP